MRYMTDLQQDKPALQAEQKRLAWSLSSQGLGQAACHVLSVLAPLTPHMLKQLLGQLQHDTALKLMACLEPVIQLW